VDPTWLVTDGQVQILYATGDGTALGAARRGDDGWYDNAQPWTTSAASRRSARSWPSCPSIPASRA
jgi:hypothetical protein